MALTYIAECGEIIQRRDWKLWLHFNISVVYHICHYVLKHFRYKATSEVLQRTELVSLKIINRLINTKVSNSCSPGV